MVGKSGIQVLLSIFGNPSARPACFSWLCVSRDVLGRLSFNAECNWQAVETSRWDMTICLRREESGECFTYTSSFILILDSSLPYEEQGPPDASQLTNTWPPCSFTIREVAPSRRLDFGCGIYQSLKFAPALPSKSSVQLALLLLIDSHSPPPRLSKAPTLITVSSSLKLVLC